MRVLKEFQKGGAYFRDVGRSCEVSEALVNVTRSTMKGIAGDFSDHE